MIEHQICLEDNEHAVGVLARLVKSQKSALAILGKEALKTVVHALGWEFISANISSPDATQFLMTVINSKKVNPLESSKGFRNFINAEKTRGDVIDDIQILSDNSTVLNGSINVMDD